MPGAKTFKCGECGDSIGKSHGSIQCKLCKRWFHLHCTGVTDKHLAVYKEMLHSFSFICKSCSDSPPLVGSPDDDSKDFKKCFDELTNTLRNDNNAFRSTVTQLLSEFKSEISSCIKEMKREIMDMKTDILDCHKFVECMETSTSSKICALEIEMSALHRRLNRGDIVVSGLPSGLNNLSSAVVSLCKHYNIDVSANDLYQTVYINKMKQVLIKFNNISIRDALMREYFKTRMLKVKDVIGGDIDRRLYLNDHFSPVAAKLNSQCRKMQRLKIIAKYKIMNGDTPKAVVTCIDGKQLEWDLAECNKYVAINSNL